LAEALALAAAFNLLSGIIALLVSYYAFNARRVIENSLLSALSFGFMFLGGGLIVEVVIALAIGHTAADVSKLRALYLLENLAYLVLQVAAFLSISIGYAQATYGKKGMPAAALSSVVAYAVTASKAKPDVLKTDLYYAFIGLEFVILLLLVFIIFEGVLVYSKSRQTSSFLVLLAFALIFVAHVVVLHSILDVSGVEYALAAAIQSFGFLSLLAFAIGSVRVGPA